MPFDHPSAGIGYAAEFQTAALPWVTSSAAPNSGSPARFDFPKVTRFLTIVNRDSSTTGSISFGFTQRGVTTSNNKYILNGGQSITLELRIKSLWIQGETGNGPFSMVAGLTTIDAGDMPVLTGTLPNGDAGWSGVG